MKKIVYIILLFIPTCVFASFYPDLHFKSAILYDVTDDKILYEENSSAKSDIASLTKIMTTITAIENIEDLNTYVKYTDSMQSLVRWDASVAGLKVGDQVTYKDLLYASILPSGADATTALAISTSGNISTFVSRMNDTAARIGMKNSHFINVTGLDVEGHYSTAEDVLILLKYALKNELFKDIYTTKTYTLSNNLFVKSTLFAYHTSRDTSRIIGSKTGFTAGAGRCISAYFKSSDHEFLLITLGAPNDQNFYHILDALDIIDFVDKNYKYYPIIRKNTVIETIPVKNSKIDYYTLQTNEEFTKFLPSNYDSNHIKIEYTGLEELSFKNKPNDFLGTAKYYYEEELVGKEDFYLEEKIEIDIFKTFYSYRFPIIIILLCTTFIIIIFINIKKAKIRLKR